MDLKNCRLAALKLCNNMRQTDKPASCGQFMTRWLFLCTFLSTFGTSLLMGYNIAVLNSPTKVILKFYNETYAARRGGVGMTDESLHLLWSFTVSVFVAAGMVGAFCTGIVADHFGRKKGLLFNNMFMLLGALLEGISKPLGYPELLIIGRMTVGINSGMGCGLVSLYLTEISPREIRGAVASCHQLAVTIGILVAQIVGLKEALGTEDGWPILVGLSGVPALISTFTLPLCPESPRFLLLNQRDLKKAVSAMQTLRSKNDVMTELEEIEREGKEAQCSGIKFRAIQLFTTSELRKATMLAIVLQIAQQWSGINAIFFYSESIFENAGLPHSRVPYAIVGTGVVNVLTTIISINLVERLGRRPLLIYPMVLTISSMGLLTISLNAQGSYPWMAYVSISCIITFIIGFALGLGAIPAVICAELFRQEPRPAAMSLAQGVNWTTNFILAISFKFLQAILQAYTFLLFMLILLLSLIYIIFQMPETKNRTFDEVAKDLQVGMVSRSVSRQSTALSAIFFSFRGSSDATLTPALEALPEFPPEVSPDEVIEFTASHNDRENYI